MDTQRRNRLMELFRAHTGAERVGDLDGVMATISPNTIYEWYPFGYRITDWNTIKEYYELCYAEEHLTKGTVTFGESASFGDQDIPSDLYWWGEKNSMIARDDLFGLDSNGVKRSMKHYTVWTLDPETDLLHGEIVLTTKFGGEMFIPILDKLADRPGFSRIVV